MNIKYEFNQNYFLQIDGYPIAYWATNKIIDAFRYPSLSTFVNCRSGIMAGDEKFIEYWFEPAITNIKFDCNNYMEMGNYRWFPLNSGGDFRRWYGNLEKVIDLWKDGYNITHNSKNYRLREKKYYFKNGITWGRITSSKIAFRIVEKGTLFGDAGPIGFVNENNLYILSYVSSNIANFFLSFINPTLNYQVGDIMRLPININERLKNKVENFAEINVGLSKLDWNYFETSWNFKKHPLI